jgi:hypothetical protein
VARIVSVLVFVCVAAILHLSGLFLAQLGRSWASRGASDRGGDETLAPPR